MLFLILFLASFLYSSTHALPPCPNCGGFPVPYPLSTSQTCGNPNYKLLCNNNNNGTSSLEFPSQDAGNYYKVLSVDQSQNRLTISPPHIQQNTCQTSDLSFGGLRIDQNSPFNISSRNTVMLFNCSNNIILSPLNCSLNSPCRLFEEELGGRGQGCQNTLCCSFLKDFSMTSRQIRIRNGGCSAYTSVVDLKPGDPVHAWNFGIELQWLPPST